MANSEVVRRVEQAVRAVLPPAADVRVSHDDSAGANVVVNGVPLEVRWVGEGSLRRAREILADAAHQPDIVVARRMSPGAREALARASIGWIDETGAAEVVLESLVISRGGLPDGVTEEKEPRWTRSVLAVAEALLCETIATVAATKAATGLSVGSCTNALRVLTDLGLLSAESERGRASGRRVDDSEQLLDAYAEAAASIEPRASLRVGVTWQDVVAGVANLGRSWDVHGVDWAATGAVAAAELAPYLTSISSARVYVDADAPVGLEGIAAAVGLRPIEGGRLTLLSFPTTTTRRLAAKTDSGLRVAPWPRVYADLRTTGVRGEEAAEHLRETVGR